MNGMPRIWITYLYALSLLPGASVLSEKAGVFLLQHWENKFPREQIYTWALVPEVPKIQQITEYVTLTAFLAAMLFALIVMRHRLCLHGSLTRGQGYVCLIYITSTFFFPIFWTNGNALAFWTVIAGALPAWWVTQTGPWRLKSFLVRRPLHVYLCSMALIGLIAILYQTAWSPELRFGNDYAGLPEYTLLSNGDAVENNQFMQEMQIPGKVQRDPCRGDLPGTSCIPMPRTSFNSPREAFMLFPFGSGLSYDWDRERLLAYRTPTREECALIEVVLRSRFLDCKVQAGASEQEQKRYPHSRFVEEFLRVNRAELGAQEQLGRFFFHHAYLYLPILQRMEESSQATAELPAQYGLGLTLTFAKVLKWFDSPGFADYFRLYWLGPGLYVLFGALVAYLLTREMDMAIAMASITIILLPFQTVDGLRMAPGFNPWRHFPDVLCMWAVGMHSRYPSIVTSVLRALALAFFFWWNKEFGLFMLAGSLSWHLLTMMQSIQRLAGELAQAMLEIFVCLLVYFIAMHGQFGGNELALYNLLGVGSAQTGWVEDVFTSGVIWLGLLSFATWVRFRPTATDKDPTLDVAGIGIAYAAFSSIYALWNPSPAQYSVVWLCAALPLLCLFHWGIRIIERKGVVSRRWCTAYAAVALSIAAIVTSWFAATSNERYFSKLFKTHQTFQWKFDGLTGRTTANPEPLQESIQLIRKAQPEGPLILLSRHDVLLYTAMGRVSALPYVDIPSAVIDWPMIDSIAQRIQSLRPPVLFMDRDVFMDRSGELNGEAISFTISESAKGTYRRAGQYQFLMNKKLMGKTVSDSDFSSDVPGIPANLHRLGHLAALAQLARQVSTCYVPGTAAGLIQAWYRRCP